MRCLLPRDGGLLEKPGFFHHFLMGLMVERRTIQRDDNPAGSAIFWAYKNIG